MTIEINICPYTPGKVGTGQIPREALIERIHVNIRQTQSNGCLLYGQRRIGKTTLLRQLHERLPPRGGVRTVLLDLADKIDDPLERVLIRLADEIADGLDIPERRLPRPIHEKSFRDAFLPGLRQEIGSDRLVLLIDEFDAVTPNSMIDQGSGDGSAAQLDADAQREHNARTLLVFLEHLMVKHTWLYLVFAMGRHVDDARLSEDGTAPVNRFFRNLQRIPVSTLTQEETQGLVLLSEKDGSMRWETRASHRVWELTNGHPLLVQALCSEVWEDLVLRKKAPGVPVAVAEIVDAMVDPALERWAQPMQWLWDGLSPACKVMTSALAQLPFHRSSQDEVERALRESGVRGIGGELHASLALLKRWDLIVEADGLFNFRVDLIRRWIRAKQPLERVRELLDEINPLADAMYGVALNFKRQKKLSEALAQAQQALIENPNHGKCLALIADIYGQLGRFAEAESSLLLLRDVQPALARTKLIDMFEQQAERETSPAGRVSLYDRILEIDPSYARAGEQRRLSLKECGENAYAQGRLQDALRFFRDAQEPARADEIAELIQQRAGEQLLVTLAVYEEKRAFTDAIELVRMHGPEFPALAERLAVAVQRVEAKLECDALARRASEALASGARDEAVNLLLEVARRDIDYPDLIQRLREVTRSQSLFARTQPLLLVAGGVVLGLLLGLARFEAPTLEPPACPRQECPTPECPRQECPEPLKASEPACPACPKQECPKQECPMQECPPHEPCVCSTPPGGGTTTKVTKVKSTPAVLPDPVPRVLSCEQWWANLETEIKQRCEATIDVHFKTLKEPLVVSCSYSANTWGPKCGRIGTGASHASHAIQCIEGLTEWSKQLTAAPEGGACTKRIKISR